MKQHIILLSTLLLLSTCESKTSQVQETSTDSLSVADPRIMVAEDDPRLMNAREQALKELPFFIDMLRKHGRDTTYMFSVKADFEENGKHEHMWIETNRYENGNFYGILGNIPQMVTSYKFGDQVNISREDVEDWMIEAPETDSIMGAYSVKALGQGNLLPK